jgi:hypothetical protein
MELEFSGLIFEKYSYKISRKSLQLEPSCFHSGERTARHEEANSRFHHFSKAPSRVKITLYGKLPKTCNLFPNNSRNVSHNPASKRKKTDFTDKRILNDSDAVIVQAYSGNSIVISI